MSAPAPNGALISICSGVLSAGKLPRLPQCRSLLHPPLPAAKSRQRWHQLYGSARSLALAEAVESDTRPYLVIARDARELDQLRSELAFFLGRLAPIHVLPDWEVLPYDLFSPHPDIISERLAALAELPRLKSAVLLAAADTLGQRLAPRGYVDGRTFNLAVGDKLPIEPLRARLVESGYASVSQVSAPGEFALRGSLFDVFPMGAETPLRVDLFDDEIEAIREFDPDTQRSGESLKHVRLLPGRELPLDADSVKAFRLRYRKRFEGDPTKSVIYRGVSDGLAPPGIEFYLPLFFDATDTLLDYLPADTVVCAGAEMPAAVERAAQQHRRAVRGTAPRRRAPGARARRAVPRARGARRRGSTPSRVSISRASRSKTNRKASTSPPPRRRNGASICAPSGRWRRSRISSTPSPAACCWPRIRPAAAKCCSRCCASTALKPAGVAGWHEFVDSKAAFALSIAPEMAGLNIVSPPIAVLAEAQLFGQRARQERRRRRAQSDPQAILRDLTALGPGSPVVHEDYGVGRYVGLQVMQVAGQDGEFLVLEYAGGDKLYVPVQQLHLVSRYTGAAPESAPLHKLGTDQWAKARKRAADKIRDVAAQARHRPVGEGQRKRAAEQVRDVGRRAARSLRAARSARRAPRCRSTSASYQRVREQLSRSRKPPTRPTAIEPGARRTWRATSRWTAWSAATSASARPKSRCARRSSPRRPASRSPCWCRRRCSPSSTPQLPRPLRRLAGARRARCRASAAARNRTPCSKASSRARSTSSSARTGCCRPTSRFKDLGLVIVDEEHRFGVRDKETLKTLRAEVDVLTLTATPIPRTLNMALGGLRDLSLITTPPAERLPIKTFVAEWDAPDAARGRACARSAAAARSTSCTTRSRPSRRPRSEICASSCPKRDVRVGHGQMRERELEQVMLDFYHRRFNVLVCTTIIESGIDVPDRQHHHHRSRRPARPRAAAPAARPRRPLAPPRLRLPARRRRARR